ncbi:MAG: hypothetical protein HYW26_03890 [Candidatus Aenigmarchaeota archaeon]|nr:hypothetical protein [Candidatus Aenigmarchaeota archaeon]
MVLAPEITLPIIIGGALIDSINPCVIGVLLLMITILVKAKKRNNILKIGAVYVAGVYFTYLLGGLTLLHIFNAVREVQFLSQVLYGVIGTFVLLAGFLEVKDFFWYGHWFSLAIPARFVRHVERNVHRTHASLWGAFMFGVLVTLVELPCTGAPYLAVLALMSQIDFSIALIYLLLYNLVFVVPLIAIIYLAYTGTGLKKMELWRREHRGKMRLAVGLFLLALGTWIISIIYFSIIHYVIAVELLILAAMFVLWKSGWHREGHD